MKCSLYLFLGQSEYFYQSATFCKENWTIPIKSVNPKMPNLRPMVNVVVWSYKTILNTEKCVLRGNPANPNSFLSAFPRTSPQMPIYMEYLKSM